MGRCKIVLLRLFSPGLMLLYTMISMGQTKKISVDLDQVPLKQALELIQQKGNISLLYSDEVVSDTIMVTAHFTDIPVTDLLDSLLSEKGLFFTRRPSDLLVIGSDALRIRDSLKYQNMGKISGAVIDNEGVPIRFASVALVKKNVLYSGVATDENGKFILTYDFQIDSTYAIHVSCINFLPDSVSFTYPDTMSVKTITLRKDKGVLDAVIVKSDKPMIERLSDRFILNVEGTALQNEGDLFDVLRNAPGVWIDADGTIHLSGNQSVMVMINGIIQRMSGADLVYFLRGIKSSDIKKIEVLSNPPAEFEAAATGGIINIVLKKSAENGLKGNLSGIYEQQQNRPYYSPSGMLNFKSGKWYMFGRASFTKDNSDYIALSTVNFADTASRYSFTNRYNRNSANNYAFGAIYDLSERQSVGIQGMWNRRNLDQDFITTQSIWGVADSLYGDANAKRKSKTSYRAGTINYTAKLDTLGSEFKLIGDYVNNNANDNNAYTSIYNRVENNTVYRNASFNKTSIYSAQADLVKLLHAGYKLSSGIKYVSTHRNNSLHTERFFDDTWNEDQDATNQFIYDEDIWMGYGAVEKKFKNTVVKTGLRAEKTTIDGNSVTLQEKFKRKYLNIFPSVFITQKLDQNTLSLNYSRRIQRPGFQSLNPFRIYFNDYSALTGNPDLQPVIFDVFRIEYLMLKKYSFSFSFFNANHVISSLAVPDSNNVIIEKPENFDKMVGYSLVLYAPVTVFKWWKFNANFMANYQRYELPGIRADKTSLMINLYNTFEFENKFSASFYINYRTPYIEGNTRWADLLTSRVTVSKSLNKDKFRITLFGDDIFNSFREKYTQQYQNMHISFYQKRPTQTVGVYFTYNFSSGKKIKEKKIEQSNADEKDRL